MNDGYKYECGLAKSGNIGHTYLTNGSTAVAVLAEDFKTARWSRGPATARKIR